MIFVRGHFGSRGFLKYYYLRLCVNDYVNMNQRRFTKKIVKQEEKEFNYRVVTVENYKGRVAWKNGTGNYVSAGDILCDITSNDNLVHSIKAPIAGLIANRFVDEGLYVSDNSLICMLKVCARPIPTFDRESYVFKRRLYSKIYGEFEKEETETQRELEEIFGEQKRVNVKDFIQPGKDHDEEDLEQLIEDNLGKKPADIPKDVLDKRRKDEFEKHLPQDIKDEIKAIRKEKDFSAIQPTDRTSNEFYKELVDETFTSVNKQQLQIVNRSERSPTFLHISTEMDVTSALQFALNEGERNNIKSELKYLILLGCIRAFKELPFLINSKDNSINITMGIIAGGKLTFSMIKNLEKDNFFGVKDKLSKIRMDLIDGKAVKNDTDTRGENESLAITNEWDYGCMSGPSCLYVSKHANLSLNGVTMKPRISDELKVNYFPVMSTTLTFNNDKIDGQDALLFLNKLKESIEQLQYASA